MRRGRALSTTVRTILTACATFALATACPSPSGPGPSPTSPLPSGSLGVVTPGAAAAAVRGLCRAAQEARAGNVLQARAAFFDQAHDELHVIASALELSDREDAARLLEDIQSVEFRYNRPLAADRTLPRDTEALAERTRASLARLGITVPGCSG